MSEVRRIEDQLRRAMDGGAWHGAALGEIIGSLGAAEAASRPLPDAHTPWEIVLHIAVWLEVVARRILGEEAEPTPAEDWPAVSGTNEAEWAAAKDRLARAYDGLRDALEGLEDDDLGRAVAGREYDLYFMLHGVVQHTLYHGGQIAVLGKALRA